MELKYFMKSKHLNQDLVLGFLIFQLDFILFTYKNKFNKIIKNNKNCLTNCFIYHKIYEQVFFRGVAQLVERAVWDREVGGSRPSTPTSRFSAICKSGL